MISFDFLKRRSTGLVILWYQSSHIFARNLNFLSKFLKLHNLESQFSVLLRRPQAPPVQKIEWNLEFLDLKNATSWITLGCSSRSGGCGRRTSFALLVPLPILWWSPMSSGKGCSCLLDCMLAWMESYYPKLAWSLARYIYVWLWKTISVGSSELLKNSWIVI